MNKKFDYQDYLRKKTTKDLVRGGIVAALIFGSSILVRYCDTGIQYHTQKPEPPKYDTIDNLFSENNLFRNYQVTKKDYMEYFS